MPDDADQDNEYLVTVEARDDAFNYARLDVTVDVTNSTGAEEPTITTTSNPSPYRENGTGTVYTFRARDPQGRAVSWSVTGTDSHAFDISSSGVLTFRSSPDFENPTDSGRDNMYEITVVVTDDQSLTDSVDVTVTVTNHNEGVEPTISTRRPSSTYRENGTSTVYTFRALIRSGKKSPGPSRATIRPFSTSAARARWSSSIGRTSRLRWTRTGRTTTT